MNKTIIPILCLILTACASSANLPSATPMPTLTATHTPTITPSATPTPTPTSTPVPGGPCDNPLVPLAVGNQWKYRVTTDGGGRNYSLKVLERKDVGNLVMVVEFGDDRESIREQVVCLDGAIDNFPLFVMDMLFADKLNKFMNTYHDKGVYAPAYTTFEGADWILDWETSYLTEEEVRIKNPLGLSDLFILSSSPIDLTFQMDGTREAVTVPAGEFSQALKVFHGFTVSATLGSNGGHLTLETTQWYMPYVGLVRAQVDMASYSMGIQTFGVPWNSVLELIEFTPAN